MVEKLTAALVSTAGEPMRPATWVSIDEVAGGAWGIGGKACTPVMSSGSAPVPGWGLLRLSRPYSDRHGGWRVGDPKKAADLVPDTYIVGDRNPIPR
ncbi:MAG: Tautomerase enzyme, partial [Acidimicrobiaceae bacterium]|nr:Tautomerase enzyme [Acidimicrobiaceae bacterium]